MDVVVTCPKHFWKEWLEEGDLPGDPWSGQESHFFMASRSIPRITPGERVYIVAYGRLRGYAPLVRLESPGIYDADLGRVVPGGVDLIRRGQAIAVTIAQPIPGFRGWRYRTWNRADETAFLAWKDPHGVSIEGDRITL